MITLRALGRYVNEPRGLAYNAGDVFDADPSMASYLLADAPGTFEQVVQGKQVEAPPANKAVKAPERSKSGGVL